MTKEQLIFELDVLATEAMMGFEPEDAKKLKVIMEQYLEAIKLDAAIDKRAMGNLFVVYGTFERDCKPENHPEIVNLFFEIFAKIEEYGCPAILEIDKDPDFHYENEDSIREWMLTH